MKNSYKKYILCIDTTTSVCGVALVLNNKIISEININNGFTHSVTLFPTIDKIFKKNKISIKDIDLIKVANGPGSFTGIRIGIACALGLSAKYNTKIEYVDTLKSIAYNVKDDGDYIMSMIDAKCDRIYLSIYKSKTFSRIIIDKIVDVEKLCVMLNNYFYNKNINFIFVGDGANAYNNIFKKLLKINYKIAPKNLLFNKSSSLAYVSGISSKIPIVNYLQASKAEREKYGKN